MGFAVSVNFANDGMNARIKQAFAAVYGLTVPDPNDPTQTITLTPAQNRDYRIKQFIKEIVRSAESQAAIVALPPVVADD